MTTKTKAPAGTGATTTTEVAVSAPTIIPELIERAAAAWWDKLNPTQREKINGRFERAKAIALAGEVTFTSEPNIFKVKSQSVKGNYYYTVQLYPDARVCNCPDVPDAPGGICKHIMAAHITRKSLELTAPEPPADEPAATDEIVSMVYHARPVKDTIIYAVLQLEERIPVEILHLDDGRAIVRALPALTPNGLVPVFPFPSPFGGDNAPCWSTAEVNKDLLTDVKVFTR